MMIPDMTPKQLAKNICFLNGWGNDEVEKLTRQIKKWRSAGLLDSQPDGDDSRTRFVFGMVHALKARLLVSLADLGLSVEEMTSVLGGIEPKADFVEWDGTKKTPKWKGDEAFEHHFSESVTRKVRAGQHWKCRIQILRQDGAKRAVTGWCERLGEPSLTETEEAVVRNFRASHKLCKEIDISIDLNAILTPLFGEA